MKNSFSEFLAVTEGKRLCNSVEICTETDEELAEGGETLSADREGDLTTEKNQEEKSGGSGD